MVDQLLAEAGWGSAGPMLLIGEQSLTMKSLRWWLLALPILSVVPTGTVATCVPDPGPVSDRLMIRESAAELNTLFSDYWEFVLRDSPEFATAIGRHDYDDRWRDWSEPARLRSREQRLQYLEKLNRFELESLSGSDRSSVALLRRNLTMSLQRERYDTYLFPVLQLSGFHNQVYTTVEKMPVQSIVDYENIIARIDAVPTLVRQRIDLLSQGNENGIGQPAVVVARVLDQLSAQSAQRPEESPLLRAFWRFPAEIPREEQHRLRREAKRAYTTKLLPAWKEYAAFLEVDYIPRPEISISSLPGGRAMYQELVRLHTTTDLTPEEIHQLGLKEVSRIDGELQAIVEDAGFESTYEFYEHMRRPENRFQSREDMLESARNYAMEVEPELSKLFKRLPQAPFAIRPVTADREASTPHNYSPPTADASRAAVFNLNTARYESSFRSAIVPLVLHETIPGHHLQIALALEQEALPEFRRAYRVTAYTEGWAFYAESLGEELGVYQSPASRWWKLWLERARAARLVVDTGIHAMGWKRETAIEYLKSPTEMDRYIGWPGQALAYKLGELRIKELRRMSQEELGSEFDVREFHDVVLRNGALPLDLLGEEVSRYIDERR